MMLAITPTVESKARSSNRTNTASTNLGAWCRWLLNRSSQNSNDAFIL